MDRIRSASLGLLLLSAVATPTTALARPSVLQDGGPMAVVLGSEIDVLALRHFPDRGFTLTAGPLGTDVVALANLYSLPSFSAGIAIAPGLVIGANLELAFIHSNPDGAFSTDTNIGLIGIVPFFEYWLPGETIAPFVGLQFGPSITVGDGFDGRVWLTAGARGGLHFFAGDSFSVGPFGQFNFVYTSHDERAGYEIVIGLSLRGWIGLGGGGGGGGDFGTQPEPQPANDPPPPPPPETTNPEQGLGY